MYHGASAYFLVSAVPVGNLWATFVGVRVDDDTAPQVASGILASEAQQFRLQRLLRHSEIRTHFFDEASEGLAYLGG
jgi:hypothetical protein